MSLHSASVSIAHVTCFHCSVAMSSGGAKFVRYGQRTVLAHIACQRSALVAHAAELDVFPVDDPNRTDQQLIDAIAAEKLAGEWLDRLEKLPTDEAKRAAVHQLRLSFDELQALADEETSGGRL